MKTTIDTAAIANLRTFAVSHATTNLGHLPRDVTDRQDLMVFAHTCTAALQGEEWAIERVTAAVAQIGNGTRVWKLHVIRSTDCTRPDGAIARSVEV